MDARNTLQKVLLINPPNKVYVYPDGQPAHRKHCTPPLGTAYLAAGLLRGGCEVSVIDAVVEGYEQEWYEEPFLYYGLTTDQLVAKSEAFAPDLIGISAMYSNMIKEVFALVQALKARFPDVPIVLGGQHPSGAPIQCMKCPAVDFVLTGEADISLPALVDALNGKIPLADVKGLWYRDGESLKSTMESVPAIVTGNGWKYYRAKLSGIPMELDRLPYPAWHLFPMDAYWKSEVRIGGGDVACDRYAVMVRSRGCPHACTFCTSPLQSGWKGYRQRSNENVLAEIRWLRDTWGIREIEFLDDNFFVGKPQAKAFLRILAKEFPDMVFGTPGGTEVNVLDAELIDLLAAAHFHKILLAVEAGDPEVQGAQIDKHVQVDRLPELVAQLKAHGIETRALYMIGFPGETRAQIEKTVQLAQSLDVDDFYISLTTPLPGTPLFDECLEKDLFVEGFDVNNIRFSMSNIRLPDTSAKELEEVRQTVWREAFEAKRKDLAKRRKDAPRTQFTDTKQYEWIGYRTLSQITPRAAGQAPVDKGQQPELNQASCPR